MTDAVEISIISGACTIIVASISAYFSYKAKVQSKQTHIAVNSRMDEFISNAKQLFHAQGVIQEKEDEQKRKDKSVQ